VVDNSQLLSFQQLSHFTDNCGRLKYPTAPDMTLVIFTLDGRLEGDHGEPQVGKDTISMKWDPVKKKTPHEALQPMLKNDCTARLDSISRLKIGT
jgi:hypothetical protein